MATGFSPIGANASVHQLDHRQLNEIIMPDLHDMANNADLLERVRDRRFNRDEPPPYRSPSPDDDDDDDDDDNDDGDDGEGDGGPFLWPASAGYDIIAKIDELVRQPLSEQELRDTQRHLELGHPAYHPGRRYEKEAARDAMFDMKEDAGLRDPKIREQLEGRAGKLRQKVFIRHRIKKRWERLGVWNPEWGIPGRVNGGPRDKTSSWKWRWQGNNTPDRGADPEPYIPQHPNSRAVHLRQGLRRGERGPLPPRHSLAADASKSAAESFITSRPWYIYGLDEEEERTRLGRIPRSKERFYNMNYKEHVAARWKERGDWVPYTVQPRWKWRHESPSPEPEGLSNTMDFTPSEIDALEAIPPPTPQPPPSPPRRWVIVPGTEHQLVPKFKEVEVVFSPEPQRLSNVISDLDDPWPASKAEANFSFGPKVPVPEAGVAQGREGLDQDAAPWSQPHPYRKSGSTPRDAPQPKLRRSARIAAIAERARQLDVTAAAAAQTNPARTARPQKRVSHKPKKSLASSTAGAGSVSPAPKRGRGCTPKTVAQPKTSKPQGIAKKNGRPRRKT